MSLTRLTFVILALLLACQSAISKEDGHDVGNSTKQVPNAGKISDHDKPTTTNSSRIFQSKKDEANSSDTSESKSDPILPEWGGNCTQKHWKKCAKLPEMWTTNHYVNVKKPELGFAKRTLNCTTQPILCLRNGWTVTECQYRCMHGCNREFYTQYDKYVAKKGEC